MVQGNMTELEAKNTIIGVFQNYKSKPAEEDYARSLVSQLTAKGKNPIPTSLTPPSPVTTPSYLAICPFLTQ